VLLRRFLRCRGQLQDGRELPFNQAREQDNLAVGKFQRIVMGMQFVCVHLSKAGHRCADFLFARPHSIVTEATLEFDVIVERDLCSRNQAHCGIRFSDCREPPRQGIGELCCHQPVTDLGWSSGDALQTVITHDDDLHGSPPHNYQSSWPSAVPCFVVDLNFTAACCDTGMTAKDGYDIEAGIVSVVARSFATGSGRRKSRRPHRSSMTRFAARSAKAEMHRAAAKPGGASRRKLAAAVSDGPGWAELVARMKPLGRLIRKSPRLTLTNAGMPARAAHKHATRYQQAPAVSNSCAYSVRFHT
jgi:hypothetical protein